MATKKAPKETGIFRKTPARPPRPEPPVAAPSAAKPKVKPPAPDPPPTPKVFTAAELVQAFWSVGPGHLSQLGEIADAVRREKLSAAKLRLLRFSVPRAETSGGTTAGRQTSVRDLLDNLIQEAK